MDISGGVKEKICFLYAGDNRGQEAEIEEFVEKINYAMNNKPVRIVIETSSGIPRYEGMCLEADFEKYEGVFFLLKEFCTDGQKQLIHQYIQYRKIKESEKEEGGADKPRLLGHRCDGYFFQQKNMPIDDTDQSIIEMNDLVERAKAYSIPCLTLDTVKLGMLITISSACRRHGYGESMEMHDSRIWIENKPVLSVKNIPEILTNRRLGKIKHEIEMVEENKDIDEREQTERLQTLRKELSCMEERLLLNFCMVYDFMNQWDEAGRELVGSLYGEIVKGNYV